MLIPSSQSIPCPTFALGNHKFISRSVSLFLSTNKWQEPFEPSPSFSCQTSPWPHPIPVLKIWWLPLIGRMLGKSSLFQGSVFPAEHRQPETLSLWGHGLSHTVMGWILGFWWQGRQGADSPSGTLRWLLWGVRARMLWSQPSIVH